MTFVNGCAYEGEFQHGEMHGEGTFIWGDGCAFTGKMAHNKPSGHGRLEWANGDRYEGDIAQGLRQGHGSFHVANSPVHYVGQWLAGRRHGKVRAMSDAGSRSGSISSSLVLRVHCTTQPTAGRITLANG